MRKMKKMLSLVLSLVLVCGIVAGLRRLLRQQGKREQQKGRHHRPVRLAKIQAAGVAESGHERV